MARVREARAMVAGMAPKLVGGVVVFATLAPGDPVAGQAIATMTEAEGLSVILPSNAARAAGIDGEPAFRQITLTVHSALDGVGLSAAVSAALASEGIPANIVAGNHHDHVFVPAEAAERALDCLRACAEAAE